MVHLLHFALGHSASAPHLKKVPLLAENVICTCCCIHAGNDTDCERYYRKAVMTGILFNAAILAAKCAQWSDIMQVHQIQNCWYILLVFSRGISLQIQIVTIKTLPWNLRGGSLSVTFPFCRVLWYFLCKMKIHNLAKAFLLLWRPNDFGCNTTVE